MLLHCLYYFPLSLSLCHMSTLHRGLCHLFLYSFSRVANRACVCACVTTRVEGDAYTQYKSMIVATGLQLLLLMFELLACDKLDDDPHRILWILVFIPLFCVSIASIGLCVWALKHGRTFEVSTSYFLMDLHCFEFVTAFITLIC